MQRYDESAERAEIRDGNWGSDTGIAVFDV